MDNCLQRVSRCRLPIWLIAVLCICKPVRADENASAVKPSQSDQTTPDTPSPVAAAPSPMLIEACVPIPLPLLADLFARRDVWLSALRPPTLEDNLAAASQLLQVKTAAAAPLVEAVVKAEAELAPAQTALAAAQQEAASLQQNIDAIAAEIAQINALRSTNDAERGKHSATLVQLNGAQPLVAEALRHLTEAVGKAPTDTTLTEAHTQLTEKLKSIETNAADLQVKINELTAGITTADANLTEATARSEAARQQLAAVAARVATLQSESEKLAAALEAARASAAPAQSEVAQAQLEVERWQNEIAFRDLMASLEVELAAARALVEERQAALNTANEHLAAAQTAAKDATARVNEASGSIDAINAKIQSARSEKQNTEPSAATTK